MPPFITGVSALNFMTRYKFGIDAPVIPDLSYLTDYVSIVSGITSLHGSNSTYGDRISAIEYMGNGVILVGTSGGTHARIYKSTDSGDTWSIAQTFTNINHVSAIERLGTSNTHVLVATGGDSYTYGTNYYGDGNIYRSTNAGDSWAIENDPSKQENLHSLEYIHNNVFVHGGGNAEGDGSVSRSADGGQNWVELKNSNYQGHTQTGNTIWNNVVVFQHSATNSNNYNFASAYWVKHIKYVGNGVVLANRRPARWLGGASGTVPEVIRSTDYGINWTRSVGPYITDNFLNGGELITENLGNGKVIGVTNAEGSTNSNNANVYISTDYGANWDRAPKFTLNRNRVAAVTHLGNGHVVFLAYHYDGSAYLTNAGEVYESLDYGETWNPTPVFDPGVMFLESAKFNPDDSVLYVGGSLNDTAPVLYKLG